MRLHARIFFARPALIRPPPRGILQISMELPRQTPAPPPLPHPAARNMRLLAARALFAAVSAAGAAVLFVFDPAQSGFYPACPLHFLSGLDCPACGSLRAAHLFLRGHLREAFAINPYLFAAIPFASLAWLRPEFRSRRAAWILAAALVAVFVLRNAPRFLHR